MTLPLSALLPPHLRKSRENWSPHLIRILWIGAAAAALTILPLAGAG